MRKDNPKMPLLQIKLKPLNEMKKKIQRKFIVSKLNDAVNILFTINAFFIPISATVYYETENNPRFRDGYLIIYESDKIFTLNFTRYA